MKQSHILLIFFILLSFSCTSEKDKVSTVVDLDKTEKISISKLVDSISVVLLEAKKESMIKNIKDVIIDKKRFYIFDLFSQSVLCFDDQGKYLSKIDDIGKGLEGHFYVSDIKIDKFNDKLILLNAFGSILYYDLDCKFISKIDLPDEIKDVFEVYPINKETLMFFSWKSDKYKSFYYSVTSGNISETPLFSHSIQDQHNIFLPLKKTYYYNDSLYYNEVGVNNDVINLSGTAQRVSYSWNFGEKNNTQEQINEALLYLNQIKKKRTPFMGMNVIAKSGFPNYYLNNSFETKRYRITSLLYKEPKTSLSVFKDKKTGKDYIFRETKEGIELSFQSTSDNAVIMYKDYLDLKFFSEDALSSRQQKQIKTHNPDKDNPFLVIYYFKQ